MNSEYYKKIETLVASRTGNCKVVFDKDYQIYRFTNNHIKNNFTHTFLIETYIEKKSIFINAEFTPKAKLQNKYYFPVHTSDLYYFSDLGKPKIFNKECRTAIKKLSKHKKLEVYAQTLIYKSLKIKTTRKALNTIEHLFNFVKIFNKVCLQKKELFYLALKSPSPVIRLQAAYWIEINYDERKSEIKEIMEKCFDDFFLKLAYTAGHLRRYHHYKKSFAYTNVEKRLLIQDNYILKGLDYSDNNMQLMDHIFDLLKVKIDDESKSYIYRSNEILRFEMIIAIFMISKSESIATEAFKVLKNKNDFDVYNDILNLYKERKINPNIRNEVKMYLKNKKEELKNYKGLLTIEKDEKLDGALSETPFSGAVSINKKK